MAVRVCMIVGIVFVIVAIWGFLDGESVLIFHVNLAHNIVHLVSGIAAIGCSMAGDRVAKMFALTFGAIYGLVGILGLFGLDPLVELLHLNNADNWLHLLVGGLFVFAGIVEAPSGPGATARDRM